MISKNQSKEFCNSISLESFTQIQSFGVLLVIDKNDLKILQYSENALDFLQTTASNFKNSIITEHLIATRDNVDTQSWLMQSDKRYGQFIWKNTNGSPINIWVYVHHQNNVIILEIEAANDINLEQDVFFAFDELMKLKISKSNENLEVMSNIICKEIQRITSYDRVRLYQFEADDSGVVLGEAIKDNMESYLGLHFPDTDVPYYVRKMYLSQPLRYIPDISKAPLSMLSITPDRTRQPLDLSSVMLRAVSPVHIEYIRNMGAASSISIAIIHDNKLWGLISCQHSTTKRLSMYYRFGLLLTAEVISKQLVFMAEKADALEKDIILQVYDAIKPVIDSQSDLISAFNLVKERIASMLEADGIAFVYENNISTFGETPTSDQIKNLSDWIFKEYPSELFVTNELSSEYPLCQEYDKSMAGLLAIPLTIDMNHYLLFFRKEIISKVDWAGNPNQVLIQRNNDEYSPRNSFKIWTETVANKAKPWKVSLITAGKALQSIFANKQLDIILVKQVLVDPLTGLYNRRTLIETITNEIARVSRSKKQLAIFMLDIDRFKLVNDNFGHSAGDVVITKVSEVLKNITRTYDYAYRYGGEEFLLILNDITADGVIQKSNQIMEQIRELNIVYNDIALPKITISIGVSLSPKHGKNPMKLIEMADQALYQAKETGRDKMIVFQ